MRLSFIAVGKMRGSVFAAGFDLYQSRLRPPVTVREIEDKKSATMEEQAKSILAAIPARAVVVALDERGEAWSSTELAHKLQKWGGEGKSEIAFVIGGADGLADAVRHRADALFSLGRITLPHLLARLVLIEQIYRAHTIIGHHPYHRE